MDGQGQLGCIFVGGWLGGCWVAAAFETGLRSRDEMWSIEVISGFWTGLLENAAALC